MKPLLDKMLRQSIAYRVDAEIARDDELDRDELELSVLVEFARSGDAERYVRRDGKIGWRATKRFLETLREGETDADECNEFV